MQTCPDECVMCRYDRHTPAEPETTGLLEHVAGAAFIAFAFWFGFYVIHLFTTWIVNRGFGKGSLTTTLTVAAIFGAWSYYNRR